MLDDVLIPLWLATPLEGSTAAVSTCGRRYGFSYYDSLIVAAALDAGCKTLYSEDLQHGQQVEGLTIVDPFSAPANA